MMYITPIRLIPYDDRRDEVFKPCTYPGVRPGMYNVSNYGRVYSIPRRIIKKQDFDKDGYPKMNLCCTNRSESRNARGGNFGVHKLVAHEFVENPDRLNNKLVNHMDGDKCNPYYGNLEHCTDTYNRSHAVSHGLMATGENSPNNIYPETLIHAICNDFQSGYSSDDIRENYMSEDYTRKQINDLLRHLYNRTTWNNITSLYNY